MLKDENIIDFVACPNHDTNVGWNKLRFVGKDLIRCDLCGKEFTPAQILAEIAKDHDFKQRDLEKDYKMRQYKLHADYKEDLFALQKMGEKFDTDTKEKVHHEL